MSLPDIATPRRTYFGVQALRAVAAGLVVVHHSIASWKERVSLHPDTDHLWPNGMCGVDIFFVISGFVMTVAVPALAGEDHKAWVFLRRRFIRIVPLYWIFTTFRLLRLSFGPHVGRAIGEQTPGSAWHVVASYLFIPAWDDQHAALPILAVGWTLNFEMLFYGLFAIALALDVPLLAFLPPILVTIAAAGFFDQPSWPAFTTLASPMILEFLFGVLVAHWALRGRLPGTVACALWFVGGVAAIATLPSAPFTLRWLYWGVPAAAIVAATVGLENHIGKKLPNWLLEAGNASYATYLVHRFMLSFVWFGLLRIGHRGPSSLATMIVLCLLVSLLSGEVVHRFIELPVLKLFKRHRVPGVDTMTNDE